MTEMVTTAKEQFDRQASEYDEDWNSWSQATLDWLLESSDATGNETLLDVATGSGFTAIAFAPHVRQAIGMDVSAGMLSEARNRVAKLGISNIEFLEGAAEKLPFGDHSFDIVTCRIAAHHFVNIKAFALEAHRVLRPLGKLLIADTSVPEGDFLAAIWQNEIERIRDHSHCRNYSKREWHSILDRVDFTVEEITDSGTGIRIPLSDWMKKSGCDTDQEAELRQRFADAPANVRREFQIVDDSPVGTHFTWQRVLIKAIKTD